MEFLDKQFYGNTITDWAIALGIILGSFIAVKISYWIISNIISRITQKTKTRVDDVTNVTFLSFSPLDSNLIL